MVGILNNSVLLNKQIEKTLKVYISFGDLESAGQWMKYEIKVLDYKIEKDKSSKSFGVLETAGKWLKIEKSLWLFVSSGVLESAGQ